MENQLFKYIIAGGGNMAISVHSSMLLLEMQDYVRRHSKKIHYKGNDVIFSKGLGGIEIVNPIVYMPDDFVNHLSYLFVAE